MWFVKNVDMKSSPVLMALCLLLLSSPMVADEHSAAIKIKDLTCSTVEVLECAIGLGCNEETAVSMPVPQFLRFDLEEQVIRARRADGTILTTPILSSSKVNSGFIFQGVEQELAWSILISELDGRLSLSVTGDKFAYVIFGSCDVF
jgi:hypothetical protein